LRDEDAGRPTPLELGGLREIDQFLDLRTPERRAAPPGDCLQITGDRLAVSVCPVEEKGLLKGPGCLLIAGGSIPCEIRLTLRQQLERVALELGEVPVPALTGLFQVGAQRNGHRPRGLHQGLSTPTVPK